MRRVKAVFRLVPMLAAWAVLGAFFWGFIYIRVTDTDAAHKIVVCADAPVPGAAELEETLDRACAGSIRMTKVRPFTYAMMDSSVLRGADLLIVRESNMPVYLDWFAPCPASVAPRDGGWPADGVRYGVLLYSPGQQNTALSRWIGLSDGDADGERFYLCFGKQSLHVEGLDQAVDGESARFAALLLDMAGASDLSEQLQDVPAEDLAVSGVAETE